MIFADKKTAEKVRAEYPAGCRIVLDRMEDAQAPKVGTQGTVKGVDDGASICPAWDDAGGLNVLYGEDACHKIRTEDEAKVTLDWYGKHQPEDDARCPRCGKRMEGKTSRHARSRWAEIFVCDHCGMAEALEKAGMIRTLPMMEWAAIEGPQNGGGEWRG